MILRMYTRDDFAQFIAATLSAAVASLAPITSLLFFTGFVIMLDLATGIWASVKMNQKVTSRRLERTWAKFILYPAGIIFGHWCEYLLPEIPFIKGATLVLIMIEGKSLEENFGNILGEPLSRYIKRVIINGARAFVSKDKVDKWTKGADQTDDDEQT